MAATEGPILEIGAGNGALTRPLAALGRDLRAVEIDERRRRRLGSEIGHDIVVWGDGLRTALDRPTIVSNVPFHITTALLRRVLQSEEWNDAVLIMQWEVARKRAGVGGSTMLTAQSLPWYTFALHGRVPARGFRPPPNVDGGILHIQRRPDPLIALGDRRRYERFVSQLFTGRGRTMLDRLSRVRPDLTSSVLRDILERHRIVDPASPRGPRGSRGGSGGGQTGGMQAQPQRLTATQWVGLWQDLSPALPAPPPSAIPRGKRPTSRTRRRPKRN